jgi:lysophospholipase L1-like esterase
MRRKIAYSSTILIVVLALIEVTARLLGPGFMPPDRSRDVAHGEAMPNEPNLVGDDLTGWRALSGPQSDFGVPEPTHVNSRGLRSPEIPIEKGPNERRVLLLGDSTVYGVLVSDEDSFAGQLENRLQSIDPNINVLNGGCPGYSSWQALQALRHRLIDYEPDIVVIGTLWSDAQGASVPDSARFGDGSRGIMTYSAAWVFTRSWLRRSQWEGGTPEQVEFRFEPTQMPGAPPPTSPSGVVESMPIAPTHRVPLNQYEQNLNDLIDTIERSGAEAILLALPSSRDVELGRVGDFRDAYRATMSEVAEDRGVEYLFSPTNFFGGRVNNLFHDDVHPTANGHAILGSFIGESLIEWANSG